MPILFAKGEEILLPVKGWMIATTFALALFLNLLPWPPSLAPGAPDFVALAALYWSVYQPRRAGIGAAWALGLAMDVARGALFGQHALAYTVMSYAAVALHRRIQMFTRGQQVIHVFGFLLVPQLVMLVLRLASGDGFPGWGYFIGPAVAALLWPALSLALELPRRPKPDPDAI